MPRRARMALIGAGASSVLLVVVWLLAFGTGIGAHADRSIFAGFTGLQRPRVNGFASFIRDLCDPGPFVVLSSAIVATALARRRPRLALAIGVVLLGATATSELLLKPLLAAPRPGSPLPAASWPSGHATAAMSLALALVLVAPGRRRPLAAALGAAFAIGVSYSMVTLGAHYPSDILGGFLVAVIWVQLAIAGLALLDARRAAPGDRYAIPVRRALGPVVASVVAGGAGLAAIVLVRPHQAISYASDHMAFIVGAGAIAALALVLATSVMLTVRR